MTQGHVQTTSAMVCDRECRERVAISARAIAGRIGLHLQLTDGRPISDPSRVPSLVDAEGRFPRKPSITLRWRSEEVLREWRQQLAALREAGVEPSHLDSHHHAHMVPGAREAYVELARETGVRAPRLKPKRVLVLGAGMSGLTTALALYRRGHDVEVLEYQDRVGGRLISLPLKDGQFTEGGGGHFRTNMPLVCGYIGKFKLPLLSLNDGCPRYHVDGKTGDGTLMALWPWEVREDERNVHLSSLLGRYLVEAGINLDTVLGAAWPDAATLDKFDELTLKGLLKSVGASDAFIKLVDAHSAEATVDTAVLALLPDFAYHFANRNLFRIAGGNELLPRAMAKVLGNRIHLDTPVVSIKQTAGEATVKSKDGKEWVADAVVSTIPFPVLREVEIAPRLLPRKQELVDKLRWSPVVKVYVQTKAAPWLQKGVHGWPMAASDRPWERVVDITGNEPGGHGNVFFYMTGKNAEAYLRRPKESRANEVLDQFRTDLPDLLNDVITIGEFSWPDQPWIKAAFADLPVGGGWMIQEWQTPEGRLHFAGDFTTLKSGWVEGAIESGLRAARQIDPGALAEFET